MPTGLAVALHIEMNFGEQLVGFNPLWDGDFRKSEKFFKSPSGIYPTAHVEEPAALRQQTVEEVN